MLFLLDNRRLDIEVEDPEEIFWICKQFTGEEIERLAEAS